MGLRTFVTDGALPAPAPGDPQIPLPRSLVYLLQIVDRSGVVVRLPAGGSLELELVEHFTREIMGQLDRPTPDNWYTKLFLRWVGWTPVEKALEVAVGKGITTAIAKLKDRTRFAAIGARIPGVRG